MKLQFRDLLLKSFILFLERYLQKSMLKKNHFN